MSSDAPQSLLWLEPDHPFVILRLAGVFLCALPAVRELYQHVNDPKCVVTCSHFHGRTEPTMHTEKRSAWGSTIGSYLPLFRLRYW